MRKECDNLLSEIERLGFQLRNITDLVRVSARLGLTATNFHTQAKATVNFVDSRRMQDLTTAAVRDSAAMKQVRWYLNHFVETKKNSIDFLPNNDFPSCRLRCGMIILILVSIHAFNYFLSGDIWYERQRNNRRRHGNLDPLRGSFNRIYRAHRVASSRAAISIVLP